MAAAAFNSDLRAFDNFTHLRIDGLDRAGKSRLDLSVSVGPQSVSVGSQVLDPAMSSGGSTKYNPHYLV